jgi:hypothetical protein
MTVTNPAAPSAGVGTGLTDRARRFATETKASFKTTEFYAYLVAVAGVLIAAQAIGTEDNHADYFRADRAWMYIVVLTVGYMISRGIAKAGSRHHSDSQ